MSNPVQSLSHFVNNPYDVTPDRVSYVLTDVDDTITTGGKLLPEALEALWKLHEAGIRIIPVTGGSAGWADTYFRQWPVDAVITESGAIAWFRKNGVRTELIHPSIQVDGYRERADKLIDRVFREVPGSKLSSDHFCRKFDIAFDHHDEEPFLGEEGIEHICRICADEGASTGISSIHVNCWFGSFDKLSMAQLLLSNVYHLDRADMLSRVVYCGDAPNDAGLFRFFPLSFGVANVLRYESSIPSMPRFVADREGGAGFARIAESIIERNSCMTC